MNDSELSGVLGSHRLLPVIVLDRAEQAVPLGEALLAGGLPLAEITFRTPAAEGAVRALAGLQGLCVGAGTVRSVETAKRAIGAGARFVVSPGLRADVVEHCLSAGVAVVPGVITPTEVEAAKDLGLGTVKFFPADVFGGVRTLRALSAVFPEMRFVPTGGVSSGNLGEYLAEQAVLACGGSWMVRRELLQECQYDQIRRLTSEAVEIAANHPPRR